MTTVRTALPDAREIRRWDREHRLECQERTCDLLHRYAAFADWYIAIERDYRKAVRAAALAEAVAAVGRLAGPHNSADILLRSAVLDALRSLQDTEREGTR